MTAPAPSGGPSPLRVGGLALLGLGAVAGIIGLATLAASGGDGAGSPSAAAPSTITATADPDFTSTDGAVPSENPTDGSDGSVPLPSFAPGSPAPGQGGDAGGAAASGGAGSAGAGGTGGSGSGGSGSGGSGSGGAGGSGGPGAGSGGTGAAQDVRMPLRVYNNSTITGLAARGASDFESNGWTVTTIGGYNGRIPVSTVYYREGTAEKDAADFLANAFGLRAQPRFEGIQDASDGVIVILTKDYQGA